MTNSIIKKVCLALAMVILVSFAAACDKSKNEDQGKSSEDKGTSSTVVNSTDKGTPATVVKGITINNLDKKYAVLISEMKAKGINYDYQIENVDFPELDKKINLSHASGEDYDMILVNNSSIPQFYKAGVLAPLKSFITKTGIKLEYYNESALKTGMFKDDYYSIPYSPDCRVLAYNKKVLQNAGVEAPKKFDDILPIAKAVTKDGVYAYARVFAATQAAYNEGTFMLGMGAHLYINDGSKYKATANAQNMIDFVDWMKKLNPYIVKDVNLSQDQRRELFVQGRIAFYMFGPWEYDLIIGQKLKLGEDYDLITVPGRDKSGSAMGGFYLGIGSGAKNKEGAWALISEMLAPENQGKVTISLPSDSRAYNYAPFNKPEYKIFNEQMKTAEIPMPPTAQFNKINQVFSEYYDKALLDGMDTTQAMNAANKAIQELLDKE